VQLLDGTSNGTLTSLHRACGQEIPPPITSFTDSLTLEFTTDDLLSGKGFQATLDFVAVPGPTPQHCSSDAAVRRSLQPRPPPSADLCDRPERQLEHRGGVAHVRRERQLHVADGKRRSHTASHVLQEVDEDQIIEIEFETFDLEPSFPHCTTDLLIVFPDHSDQVRPVMRACG
jgi:hypothetical protein